jgi:hypothetical protein
MLFVYYCVIFDFMIVMPFMIVNKKYNNYKNMQKYC